MEVGLIFERQTDVQTCQMNKWGWWGKTASSKPATAILFLDFDFNNTWTIGGSPRPLYRSPKYFH